LAAAFLGRLLGVVSVVEFELKIKGWLRMMLQLNHPL
jgi:hypothetical protein